MINVLILGSGGREHAFAWKISKSSSCNKLFIAPGNAGTNDVGTNVDIEINDFKSIKKFVLINEVTIVLVGPEDPLVNGIYDFFQNDDELKNIALIGPSKQGAQLEGSKKFAKEFMFRHNIPTAKYKAFTKENLKDSSKFLESLSPPYVLKADGLAAGKGVLIINDIKEAKQELKKVPLFGWANTLVGTIWIDRKNKDKALETMETAGQDIKNGKNVISFPEGTRSNSAKPSAFRIGGLKQLIDAMPDAKLVGITINNSCKLSSYGYFPMGVGAKIRLKMHPPVDCPSDQVAETLEQLEKTITAAIIP